jgi:hypothetical protein
MFEVAGAWKYEVGIAPAPIVEGGKLLMGKFYEAEGVIRVSPHVVPQKRPHVVFHELRHAFLVHANGGQLPATVEADCDLTATFTMNVFKWLWLSGGVPALLALGPGETLRPYPVRRTLGQYRHCGICRTSMAGGSIEHEHDADAPGFLILRGYCPYCEHVQVWRETAGPAGLPNNDPVGEPAFVRGREMREYLARHKELGVIYLDD